VKKGVYYIPSPLPNLHGKEKRKKGCRPLKSRIEMNAFQAPLISFTRLLKEIDLVSSGKQGLFIIGNLRVDD
jgi:hypothetical protein